MFLFLLLSLMTGEAIERALTQSPSSASLFGLAKKWAHTFAKHLVTEGGFESLCGAVVNGLGATHAVRTACLVGMYDARYSGVLNTCECMMLAALCQDIGAALLDDDGEEMADLSSVQEDHPRLSVKLLASAGPIPPLTFDAIMGHHERPDGCGYPHAIESKDLKYGARLLGCARVLDQTRMSLNDPLNWSAAIQNVSKLGGGVTDEEILAGFTALIIPDKDRVELGG